jgi:hypothetical protein
LKLFFFSFEFRVANTTGKLFVELRDLQAKLINEENMCPDFIRREYATILDPSEAERQLCDRNVERASKRRF